ncbi:dephospho-CoA kinase [Ectobacillus polymachus]|uniref:dephospho-CoA kinase n=1 Tax=Ectobacillus polymachus TaxID=1508806 RepID=UPI003A85248C
MTIIIGLTGGIASGKSTVSSMFRKLNIPVIDADAIAREVVEQGKPAYDQIVKTFGQAILYEDGSINRKKLGDIIFQDEQKRAILNGIVHPAVRAEMNARKEEYIRNGEAAVVLDIPLLFESKLTYIVQKTLLVYVDQKTQIKRLMERNGFTKDEADARIASQMPLVDKIKLADAMLNNNGTLEETTLQLLRVLKQWSIIK